MTPLMLAAKRKKAEVVKLLLEAGGDTNIQSVSSMPKVKTPAPPPSCADHVLIMCLSYPPLYDIVVHNISIFTTIGLTTIS